MAAQQEVQDQQEKGQSLSVSPPNEVIQPTRGRSTSNESSIRTRVASSPDDEEIQARIRRRKTQIASVDLSYWDLFKALFGGGLKSLRQRLGATMESRQFPVPDEKLYDHEDCEYILTVTVWPRAHSEHHRQSAKCVLDTGCLQGNIISKRLAESLGYCQSDYETLSPREKQGGTVASGHKHHVLGAVRVSWAHGASTEVFRQMRFLVTESEHIDLVVGSRSIRKWNLISPPNLFTDVTKEADLKGEDLSGKESKLDSQVRNYERKLKSLPAGREREKVERWLKAKKEEHRVAKENLDAYNAGDAGKKDADKGEKKAVDKEEKKKEEKKKEEKKKKSASIGVLKPSKGQGKPNPKTG